MQKGFWGSAFTLALWLLAAMVLFICVLDLTHVGVAQYLLYHYPTDVLPVSTNPYQRVFYGGVLPQAVLTSIQWLRRQSVVLFQPILPIPGLIPLYTLLPEYDFIVVGGGTAGSVAAARLSEHQNISVLVLEAGGFPIDGLLSPELLPIASILNQNTRRDWMYRTESQTHACLSHPNNVSFWPRGKALGGSTVLNFMLYHRGHPSDYDLWATCLQDPIWSSKEVKRLFQGMENATSLDRGRFNVSSDVPFPRGFNGPLPISIKSPLTSFSEALIAAARKIGFDDATNYNMGINVTGTGALELTRHPKTGQRVSAYRQYLHPKVLSRGQLDGSYRVLHVVPFAHVSRLVMAFDDATPRVSGVEFALVPPALEELSPDELQRRPRQVIRVKKEVVLSSGAIGTPHILMNSGIGPKQHLETIFNRSSSRTCGHTGTPSSSSVLGHSSSDRHCDFDVAYTPLQLIDVPAVGQNLMDHILHPAMFPVVQDQRLVSQVLGQSVVRPLWEYFNPFRGGQGVLSTPGADTQIMVPHMDQMPRSIPAFCEGLNEKNATDESIRLLRKQPDLQILLYGGVPDVWELRDKANFPIDTPLRMGRPADWNFSPKDLKLFRLFPGTFQERLTLLTGLVLKLSVVSLMPVLMHPESRGVIELRSSNPFEKPKIDPHYLTSPRDIKVMLEGVRVLEKLMETEDWQSVVQRLMSPNCPRPQGNSTEPKHSDFTRHHWLIDELPDDHKALCNEHEYGTDEFWMAIIRRLVLTLYHPAGTCRMGRADDKMACTDSRLRLRKVQGIRLADASVMPTLPSGNTQAPVMMVGEMVAELLARDYQLKKHA